MNKDEKSAEQIPAPLTAKEEMGEFVKTALWAIALALLIRSVFLEPFNIPSGSMKPTLLVGDYLFVNKPAYGYSRFSFPFGIAPIEGRIWSEEPKRGDVIVFRLPTDTNTNFIKRLVGLPGETIQVRKGRLYINGEMIPREFIKREKVINDIGKSVEIDEYIETLPGGIKHRIYEVSDFGDLDQTDIYTVPQGHYFMMGDNRDNSRDSRVAEAVGPVPFENIVGRADFLFFSTNGYAHLFEFWKWPWSIRYDRMFMDIDPERSTENKKAAGDSGRVGMTTKAMASEH
ncbi:MAG: signal peptidase I [Alphaproteobacteria bacterium]|nr:signal peptidase I [Alphaproteobacteria bacterium]